MAKAYACVWSGKDAEKMVKFYSKVFPGTKVEKFAYWGNNPMGVKVGSVLTAHLTILGQRLMLLNGQSNETFTNAVSFVIPCKTQPEIDRYWKLLSSGGGQPVQCGWVIDKFGVRWQVCPAQFDKWNTSKKSREARCDERTDVADEKARHQKTSSRVRQRVISGRVRSRRLRGEDRDRRFARDRIRTPMICARVSLTIFSRSKLKPVSMASF